MTASSSPPVKPSPPPSGTLSQKQLLQLEPSWRLISQPVQTLGQNIFPQEEDS